MNIRKAQEERIQATYATVNEYIKEDIYEAVLWAKTLLTDREGSGHIIEVVAVSQQNLVCCSFSKPEWSGDHCGRGMSSGSEAIVMAVCEYINGL